MSIQNPSGVPSDGAGRAWRELGADRRAEWYDVFRDFPPSHRGDVAALRGGGRRPRPWIAQALAAERLGITPATYAQLCYAICAIDRDAVPGRDRILHPDLTEWIRFPALLEQGLSPKRAVERIRGCGIGFYEYRGRESLIASLEREAAEAE